MRALILSLLLVGCAHSPRPEDYRHMSQEELDVAIEECTVDVFSRKNYERMDECVAMSKELDLAND